VRQAAPHAGQCIRGGLDGLSQRELEAFGKTTPQYPLMVRLADAMTREVDMAELLPHLFRQAQALHADGADCVVLMCSGGFPEFGLSVPVLRPAALLLAASSVLATRGRVGLISPIASQQAPAAAFWTEKGFTPSSAFASPFDPQAVREAAAGLAARQVEVIVLDCMSFTDESLNLVKSCVSVPVLSPMRLVQAFLQALW